MNRGLLRFRQSQPKAAVVMFRFIRVSVQSFGGVGAGVSRRGAGTMRGDSFQWPFPWVANPRPHTKPRCWRRFRAVGRPLLVAGIMTKGTVTTMAQETVAAMTAPTRVHHRFTVLHRTR